MRTVTCEEPALVRQPSPVGHLRLLFSGIAGVLDQPPYVLTIGETHIGRTIVDARGIRLGADARLSEHHATFVLDPEGQLRIIDCHSTNGTYVNGVKVAQGKLQDNDLVRMGDSFLLVRHEPLCDDEAPVEGLIGDSLVMRTIRRSICRYAPASETVLLLGESGVGKEVIARALHTESKRKGDFVPINCSTVPAELAESELFGHGRGAFTGARDTHRGLFLKAADGTLFLDEVGDLSPAVQPKLLRAMEEGVVRLVGGDKPIKCNARIIAATNRDLNSAVDAGTFRGDLFARMTITIRIPPLRARREDILKLLLHALQRPGARLSPRLVNAVLLHSWPLNVRGVYNVAKQLRLYSGDAAQDFDLEPVKELLDPFAYTGSRSREPRGGGVPVASKQIAEADDRVGAGRPSREELNSLLVQYKGNISAIARLRGRSQRQVRRWLEEYDLDPGRYR